jgi:hypothetical protein
VERCLLEAIDTPEEDYARAETGNCLPHERRPWLRYQNEHLTAMSIWCTRTRRSTGVRFDHLAGICDEAGFCLSEDHPG